MSGPPPDAVAAQLRAAGSVWAEDEARLILEAAGSPADVDRLARRRGAGEPIEQVVGWAAFCGLRVVVRPGVFVPRRRTEFLAEQAIAHASAGSVVVDLCCGSGAIAAAVAASLAPEACRIWASDIDLVAVECARTNLDRWSATVLLGDLFAPLPEQLRGRVDVLVANVPYVATVDLALLPAEAREHEPRWALDGGTDGLDVLRRVAAAAPDWLAPGGVLLSEVAEAQVDAALTLLAATGLQANAVTDADLEATVVVGEASPRVAKRLF